jgi:hypothetical protein
MPSPRCELALLIDVAGQLRADQHRDEGELHRRDRAAGLAIEATAPTRLSRLRAWLDRVGPGSEHMTGHRADGAVQVGGFVLSLLGLIVGGGAAAAAFRYDGSQPVNVIVVLAVLVALQLALLALTLIVALPASLRRFVPGLAGLQDALSLLSPGRLIVLVVRLLPQSWRQAFERFHGQGAIHSRLFAGVYKWLVLTGSQQFAVGFNVGALVTAMALITFTHLAFGWSTTLDLRAEDVYRWTQALSLPWWWLDQARPSVELIELTRYYRSRLGEPFMLGPDADPRMPGGWWPFLVLCVAVYGMLPRLVLLLVARRRLSRAIDRALWLLPGMAELEDRLTSRWVQTATADAAEDQAVAGPGAPAVVGEPASWAGRRVVVVNWAGVPVADDAVRTRFTAASAVVAAGGEQVDADRRAIERVAGESDATAVILARSWEPPLMDLIDFLASLRVAMGDGRAIRVMPVGITGDGRLAPPAPRDLDIWRSKLAGVGDPWLKVVTTP